LTDAQLCRHVRGVFDGLPLICCEHDFEWRAFCFHHALRKSTDNLQTLFVDIHQPELIKGELIDTRQKAIDQFRGISRTSADDSDFEHIIFPRR
jgi:hypothetical protein